MTEIQTLQGVLNASQRGSRKVILVACGSGGHVFPALAVAEECRKEGWEVCFWTDSRGAKFFPPKIQQELCILPTWTHPSKARWIPYIKQIKMAFQSFYKLFTQRPDLVWGFGGGMSFFPLMWARFLGIPCGIHQSDCVLGRANRLLSFMVHHTVVGYEHTSNMPKKVHPKILGVPVRAAFEQIAPLSLCQRKLHVTLLGGSQGAHLWTRYMPKALALLMPEDRERLVIWHQCPKEDEAALRIAYEAFGISNTVRSFFENMPEVLENSHLIFSRAGASTLAELMLAGRPAFLVPYPLAKDNHQWWNAQYVVQQEGGWICKEGDLSPEKLAQFIQQTLKSPHGLMYAGICMRRMGHTQSARQLVDLFSEIMLKKSPSLGMV